MNALDIAHTKAPNFDEGSAHSPAADIEITGPQCIKLMGTQNLKLASRLVSRRQSMMGARVITGSLSFSTGDQVTDTKAGTPGSTWQFPLTRLLHGATLNAVYMWIDPADTHGAGSVTPPQFDLVRTDMAGASVVIATSTDATAGLIDFPAHAAGYELAHFIQMTGLGHVVDLGTYTYNINVSGEATGTSAYVANCQFLACIVDCQCSAYSEY
jgi:hypothetical protein